MEELVTFLLFTFSFFHHCLCYLLQGRVLIDGIALHTDVCPETMKALHERMVELLPEYLSKYGDHRASGSYDTVALLGVDETPRKRLLSSSRRRGNFKSAPQGDRPPTIVGSPVPEDLSRY